MGGMGDKTIFQANKCKASGWKNVSDWIKTLKFLEFQQHQKSIWCPVLSDVYLYNHLNKSPQRTLGLYFHILCLGLLVCSFVRFFACLFPFLTGDVRHDFLHPHQTQQAHDANNSSTTCQSDHWSSCRMMHKLIVDPCCRINAFVVNGA